VRTRAFHFLSKIIEYFERKKAFCGESAFIGLSSGRAPFEAPPSRETSQTTADAAQTTVWKEGSEQIALLKPIMVALFFINSLTHPYKQN
jgi:hypothetical protein